MAPKRCKSWGEAFVESNLKASASCGHCGSALIPDTKKLDIFFDWLRKRGKIKTGADKKKLADFDEMKRQAQEATKLKNRVALLEEQFGENYSSTKG